MANDLTIRHPRRASDGQKVVAGVALIDKASRCVRARRLTSHQVSGAHQPELKEKAMTVVRIFRTVSMVAAMGSLLATGLASAEQMDCSWSKQSKERMSYQEIRPGDRPDRQLRQYIRIDAVSSKNPQFDGTEQTVYVHEDLTGNAGRHSGYTAFVLKDGEKLWTKWEGVHYTIRTGGTWEARYQGVFHFIAGTGKYEAIRGGGHYEGIVTPVGLTEDSVCSASY